jgi:large subunit ribosomal protein L21
MYAILSHGGRQYRVSAGDRLLVDRLAAEVGSVVALQPLLLTGGADMATAHGKDLEGMRIAATVVAHRRGKKLRIFKYKAKKRSRKLAGYRSDLTELRVESILAKGAALPRAAGNGAAAPNADDHAAAKKPATARPKSATASAEKPATTVAPVGETPADTAVADEPETAEPQVATPKAAAAKVKTSSRVTKAAPKAPRATRPSKVAKEQETDDGA